MADLLNRIFEDLPPALRVSFNAGTLSSYDMRVLLQQAYSLGGADMLRLHLDFLKRPKTTQEKNS